MNQLKDNFERKFEYLRLSITDVCNFKCNYCLPDGYQRTEKKQFLTASEITNLVASFAQMGTSKVRITGGEPSLRRDFCEIIHRVSSTQGIEKVATTTNGYRMARDVADWKDAGLNAINVSVDSLDPRMFKLITGENIFAKVMAGIDAAFDIGFESVKVNTVLMRDLNSQQLGDFLHWIKSTPIQLRFIELMQTGDNQALFDRRHVSGTSIMSKLLLSGWQEKPRGVNDGPARVFSHPDYLGEIGLIMPYEKDFCTTCNRLRVSATGRLHLCLFGEEGVELRDLLTSQDHSEQLKLRVMAELTSKKSSHFLQQGLVGGTPHLASIGG